MERKHPEINILITAGGTSEAIDSVRRITNTGSGRLGSLIADAFSAQEAVRQIFYVCARDAVRPHAERISCVTVQSVTDLRDAVNAILERHTIHCVIHSMAVSDYTVRAVSTTEALAAFLEEHASASQNMQRALLDGMGETDLRKGGGKLSSQMKSPLLLLEQTPKILPLFREKLPEAVIIGFKLLHQVSEQTLLDTAHHLLVKNRCDFVLANDAAEIKGDHHHAFLMDSERRLSAFNTKQEIAAGIVGAAMETVARRKICK